MPGKKEPTDPKHFTAKSAKVRLRIGDLRVFYDVTPGQVEVVAVVPKAEAAEWLARWGIRVEEEGGAP